jgi:hypothetical protein
MDDPRATALQFRYLFVTTGNGLQTVDVTNIETPILSPSTIELGNAKRVYVARTYAYVAAGAQGLAVVDVTRPDNMRLLQTYNDGGTSVDAHDVVVASTNASLFAYVADGAGGLKVVQLTSPSLQPNFYGFSPEPNPKLIASYPTRRPALALSKGIDRDRGVDETGGQIAVFGRRGSRPLSREDMNKMYLNAAGEPWYVKDTKGTGTAVLGRSADSPVVETGGQTDTKTAVSSDASPTAPASAGGSR